MKTKLSAGLLALFFGGFGIHCFYLGQTLKGVMYFLFCWTFIPSFFALIDFLAIIIMPIETFNKRFN